MAELDFHLQGRQCPNCGGHHLKQFRANASDSSQSDVVHITECASCEFAWQYPLARTKEESIDYFHAAYVDAGKTQSDYFDPHKKRQVAELQMQFVAGLSSSRGTLLDIGAGAGIFAETAAKHGWSATALDPALSTDNRTSDGHLHFVKGTTDDLPDDALFDVVTMWDVIEHVTDPVAAISAATRHVAPGGWLVLETGNYKCADRILGGTSWWIYQLDHRWYFAPDNLADLLRRAGYSQFVYADRALRPNWNGAATYGGPSWRGLVKKLALSPLQTKRHVDSYRKLLEARSWTLSGIPIFTIAARRN